jgi:hypothetical protein
VAPTARVYGLITNFEGSVEVDKGKVLSLLEAVAQEYFNFRKDEEPSHSAMKATAESVRDLGLTAEIIRGPDIETAGTIVFNTTTSMDACPQLPSQLQRVTVMVYE